MLRFKTQKRRRSVIALTLMLALCAASIGTDGGSMAAISSVLTKWPNAVKAKKSESPTRARAPSSNRSAPNRRPASVSSA